MSAAPLVLIIDDDPDIRMIAAMSLQRHAGCEVIEADSAAGATDLLEQHRPDLILVDVMMPDMGGEALVEQLRTSRPELLDRIVFLTADARSDTIDRLSQLGCRDVLTKPFAPRELAEYALRLLASDS